ncbi:DUF411 domain-containing protein [Microvirga makkahensis]|uniref:DUF411 domain-containing protein n=1 Tax=Microvirga makkahensis TaxID=1128670 RepID=A0A7X3MW80_9HYPH|nr:DUF411 domain-containing protein [Microvirga makkahensis]MXQ14173.1 DUF411 domain-containing protein [Microvirga makkahensis]
MRPKPTISRRALLTALVASPVAVRTVLAETLPRMVVTKDPSCGCCGAWVEHARSSGFLVEVIESPDLNRVKARLGVPQNLASCHTAQIGGYVIEGHVPADAIKRLLAEKPDARGLAVPGMPVGSPGMEVAGTEPETYDVVLFGPDGQQAFARYKGRNPA